MPLDNIRETELFWNQIMMEHALFIRGLLDPTECKLLETADMFAGDYCRLLEEAEKRDARTRDGLTKMTVETTKRYRDFKAAGTKGINVGYNPKEQTVGIGESKRYLWETDREYGACILQSFGDMRNHRYHGLFGAVIVEPAEAQWYENFTKKKNPFAEQAVIMTPGTETFQEYVLFIQNGIRLLGRLSCAEAVC